MALALGRTVSELMDSISVEEFEDWKAYFALHPFGFERDNIHAAYIASTIANVHIPKNKKPIDPNVFMVKDEQERKDEESDRTIQALIRMAKPKEKANG